jgi:hypothetical protein
MASGKETRVRVKPSASKEALPPGPESPGIPPVHHNPLGDHPVTWTDLRLKQIIQQPHRHAVLHWAAFILTLPSLGLVIMWLINPQTPIPRPWLWAEVALSAFFVFEFVTRSGFRWHPAAYIRTRYFDFIAFVPALVLANFNVRWLYAWIWIILVARIIRAFDRILGDGFIPRNFFALLEGFEEEITDRVMIRIIDRMHDDVTRGKFGQTVAQSLTTNKDAVLERIRAEHPQQGLGANLARITGLEGALTKAEERVFDSVVDVLASPEVDQAIHDSLDSTFTVLRDEIGQKSWKKNLGIRFNQWKA